MICAIILAAGESRRMGQLKPLLKIKEKTFLQHISEQVQKAGIDRIFVITGFEAEKVKKESGVGAVHFLTNHEYSNGQFSSLQTGIKNLPKNCSGVLVCLVDQPHIKCEWIHKLLDAFQKTNAPIVTPKFKSKRGHPILFNSSLFEEILQMGPKQTAHDLKRNHYENIVDVLIDDEGLIFDADTPDDLKRVQGFFEK
jgi:molybdenum cofactor cytidylyltransferase